ncbi:50S ribosomal protein L19e [Methanocorpusculum sp. MG]|uniref:Large ribosomal subunit protein eL19 n=1 Tax=Methanocorpusculum petauri TaxID=3002863 RepID=A0ABT4IG58_9EURY|nr:50S ribosomal protein L19e [Methanocorpusculum petauri]MCZ0860721.1 50S ribosomal protein L19e [Methanocorpusculum petauri]MDE2443928.1 50S ribosomal protein L19e [Methanocorpusculum sp.]
MSDLASQRRIAAAVLGCGVNRVWINPEKLSEVQSAMSREDIRNLIEEGAISSHQKKGISRGRARARIAKRAYGHCKGPGRRSGAKGARTPSKTQWIKKIRAQRKELRAQREAGSITRTEYRRLYRRAAGGQFRNVAHLKAQIEIVTSRRD